jgi:hypothetical protein
MPTVTDVITQGALNETERVVLSVLENNKDHIFSTSLEDLAELAARCATPESDQPLEIAKESKLDINKKLWLWKDERRIKKDMIQSRVTLRTIAIALASLAKTKRIWSGKLHFGADTDKKAPSRIYYGQQDVRETIGLELDRTDPESRVVGWVEDLK